MMTEAEIAARFYNRIKELESLNADRQRLFDLVRYCRHKLLTDNLISQDEFAILLTSGGGSVKRLESYDEHMARIVKLEAELAKSQQQTQDMIFERDDLLMEKSNLLRRISLLEQHICAPKPEGSSL